MESEIFTSKVSEIAMSQIAQKEKLQLVCNLLNEFYAVEICFCQIIKNRWAHFVSTTNFISENEKIELTPTLGLFVPQELAQKEEWPHLVEILKKIS
jgi:hypothetical protein